MCLFSLIGYKFQGISIDFLLKSNLFVRGAASTTRPASYLRCVGTLHPVFPLPTATLNLDFQLMLLLIINDAILQLLCKDGRPVSMFSCLRAFISTASEASQVAEAGALRSL